MSGQRSVWIDIEAFLTETGAAMLVQPLNWEDENGDVEVWIPLSTIEQVERQPVGGGRILVQEWMAKKKGLI